MTINSPEQFCNSLWDWGCLDGCFGQTKIKPTDLDGFVERNGYFLVIETKLPHANIPLGQDMTFDKLIHTGYFTVLIAWGHPGKPEKMRLITRKTEKIYENTSLDTMRNIVSRWFEWADNQTTYPEFEKVYKGAQEE